MRVLFLDIDGVMNRTGYRPQGESMGLRSWIEPELAKRLMDVLRATGAKIVLSSDWRRQAQVADLRVELEAAGIDSTLLIDKTPDLGRARWQEIQMWMTANAIAPETMVIVDDGYDMGDLRERFVRCSPLNGLDADAAASILVLLR